MTVTCPLCKFEGNGYKVYSKGSIFIELVLWCFFLIPGFIYSVWRMTSKYNGCPDCGNKNIVIKKKGWL
jgi:hypothetical protein